MAADFGPKCIGNMWKRIQLQVPPGWIPAVPGQFTAVNEFNETVVTDAIRPSSDGWGTIATMWGEVHPLTGRELWLAKQIRPDITDEVTIRYKKTLPPLSPRMRFFLQSDGRKLNIAYVLPGQKKRFQKLLCREEVI
jgi:SPP1 family predicted phage head-tail adaptor